MTASTFTAHLKLMEALSRILTFPALNQYHTTRYLKVQYYSHNVIIKISCTANDIMGLTKLFNQQ